MRESRSLFGNDMQYKRRFQGTTLSKRWGLLSNFAILALLLAIAAFTGPAGDLPSFTGKYSPTDKKDKSISKVVLEVVQTGDAIEVTRVDRTDKDKRTTNRYPVDGSDGDFVSPSGIHGKCRAQFKGKQLILESLVEVQLPSSGRAIREHTRERWQLSADGKTLTIQTDVDFPDFPGEISAAVAGDTSGRKKYVRVGDQ